MLAMSFFAYSDSNFLFETPVDCSSLYLYLADIYLINNLKNYYKIYLYDSHIFYLVALFFYLSIKKLEFKTFLNK